MSQPLDVLALTLWLVISTVAIPVFTYSRYRKRRHLRGAKRAFLLLAAGFELLSLVFLFNELRNLGWLALIRDVTLFNGVNLSLNLLVTISLNCGGWIVLVVASRCMPDPLQDGAGDGQANGGK